MFFSVFSTGMMGYLAMSTQLGPWVAPIFSVVVMTLIIPFFNAQWIKKHAIIIITSGSVGGMIGICLGFSLPSFYFMHRSLFEYWVEHTNHFFMIVGAFVLVSASYAFLIAYVLRDYFLVKTHPDFPMSKLIYDVIYIDKNKNARLMMLLGLFGSGLWNALAFVPAFSLSSYSSFIHMTPLLSSVGFITALNSAVSILIGLIIRVIILRAVHIYIPSNLTDYAFLITFCSGMLFSWFVAYFYDFLKEKPLSAHKSFLFKMSSQKWFVFWCLGTAAIVLAFFAYWNMNVFMMFLMFALLMLLARYMVDIISVFGIIEIDTYVWFLLLMAIYFIPATSLSIVALSIFSMICLGLVVNFMFSYKLADFSGIDYKVIIKYQLIAVISSACVAGFWFWYLNHVFGFGSFDLIANKTHELDAIIKYGKYNYKIFLAGFGLTVFLRRFTEHVLTITGGVLMSPYVSTALIASGAVAHLIKDRQRLYPVCFGVYAGHMLWMVLSALK
jgi:hypothetical protein